MLSYSEIFAKGETTEPLATLVNYDANNDVYSWYIRLSSAMSKTIRSIVGNRFMVNLIDCGVSFLKLRQKLYIYNYNNYTVSILTFDK